MLPESNQARQQHTAKTKTTHFVILRRQISAHALAAGGLEKHLLEGVHMFLCMKDGDS